MTKRKEKEIILDFCLCDKDIYKAYTKSTRQDKSFSDFYKLVKEGINSIYSDDTFNKYLKCKYLDTSYIVLDNHIIDLDLIYDILLTYFNE